SVLPDERARLQPLAEAFSEEDLLRIFETLTDAESEMRLSLDPRVSLELALLKLVHMRRLMPFAELVDRVERLAGGVPARAPRPASAATPPPPAPPRPAAPSTPEVPGLRSSAVPPPGPVVAAPRPVPGGAAALLDDMVAQCQTRPSLVQPLRGAQARLEGDTLVLEGAPDWAAFASTHADEYRELARSAARRPLKGQIGWSAALEEPPPPPSPEEVKRHRLRQEAEREPAVQEALDLFEGKVLDVRESKPGKEGA